MPKWSYSKTHILGFGSGANGSIQSDHWVHSAVLYRLICPMQGDQLKRLSRQQVIVAETGVYDIPLFYAVCADIVRPSSCALSEDHALARQLFQRGQSGRSSDARAVGNYLCAG